MSKHTPGPWTHRPSPVDPKPYRCVYFSTKRDEPYSTSALLPADAKLISAAPDLLDALNQLLPFINDAALQLPELRYRVRQLKALGAAALAKAAAP
jgi:hypothetical protein